MDTGSPVIESPPRDVHVMAGNCAQLLCRASGYPAPSVSWLVEGAEISSGDKYNISSSGSLTICPTNCDDSALYECRASNERGNVSAVATLNVAGELQATES